MSHLAWHCWMVIFDLCTILWCTLLWLMYCFDKKYQTACQRQGSMHCFVIYYVPKQSNMFFCWNVFITDQICLSFGLSKTAAIIQCRSGTKMGLKLFWVCRMRPKMRIKPGVPGISWYWIHTHKQKETNLDWMENTDIFQTAYFIRSKQSEHTVQRWSACLTRLLPLIT
jgi:hypothetical protein